VVIPERPGAFKQLYAKVYPRNVTEFSYRYNNGEEGGATVFISVETEPGAGEAEALVRNLKRDGIEAVDLSDNEMAKSHTRYLVGGRPAQPIQGEKLFRFEFPERPGALKHFLDCLPDDWSVTLFHYRNHGTDVGKVLTGITLPSDLAQAEADSAWAAFLEAVGYSYTDETDNSAALFVQ